MKDLYELPLVTRYATKKLSAIFSAKEKYLTWRKLWLALAKAEKKQGLPITDAQITALEKGMHTLDFTSIERYEKETKHEVMAHIHAYGDVAKEAAGILHLGATSSFVMDNGDLVVFKKALEHIYEKLLEVLYQLSLFAEGYASLPCVGYTHFQEAQPTTVGKRAATWLQDLYHDALQIQNVLKTFPFLGVRGATGTQSSFLALLGSKDKIDALEKDVAHEMGFSSIFSIATQTYPRKFDATLSHLLTAIATSLHKFATDVRLLSHTGEILEPFEELQVGSSAMPYKRNPMRSERICSLARYVISLDQNSAYTAGLQWLERSLDDSAQRRLTLPQQFLSVDALLRISGSLIPKLNVEIHTIRERYEKAKPKFAEELVVMHLFTKGLSRQKSHDMLLKIREPITLKKISEATSLSENELESIVQDALLIGTAPSQVKTFIKEKITPLLHATSKTPPDDLDV